MVQYELTDFSPSSCQCHSALVATPGTPMDVLSLRPVDGPDRLHESAFRALPCNATIDMSGLRSSSRTPDWLTCSPATWTKHHLEPYLLTAVHAAGSWHLTENAWMVMNLLPCHEAVLIAFGRRLCLSRTMFLVLGVCASTAVLVWPVMEVARINENSIFERLLDDRAEAMLKFLFNLEWFAWPCEWVSERENHLQTVVCEEDFKEFWMPRTGRFLIKNLTMLLERKRITLVS